MTLPLMIFAAGFGTRMGALTADRPKPMIPVAGRPLIDHALGVGQAAGCAPVVVNLHYLGDQIAAHLRGREVRLAWERDRILDTGGGLRAALPLLGAGPVATLNADAVWTGPNPIDSLRAAWDPARMEALLLLAPLTALPGARADFAMDTAGRLARHAVAGGPGLAYLGAQILIPDDLHAIDEPVFSLNRLWDRMIARGTLFGAIHPGGWCDVGHPAGITAAEALLRDG